MIALETPEGQDIAKRARRLAEAQHKYHCPRRPNACGEPTSAITPDGFWYVWPCGVRKGATTDPDGMEAAEAYWGIKR